VGGDREDRAMMRRMLLRIKERAEALHR